MAKKTITEPLELPDIFKLVAEKKLAKLGFTSLDIMGPNPLDIIRALNEAGVVVEIGGKAQGRALGSGLNSEQIEDKYDEIAAAIAHAESGDSVRSIAADFNVSPTTVQKVRNAMRENGIVLEDDEWEKNLKYIEKHLNTVEKIIEMPSGYEISTVSIVTLRKVKAAMLALGYNLSRPMDEQSDKVKDTFSLFFH